jgi:hypothetical protein
MTAIRKDMKGKLTMFYDKGNTKIHLQRLATGRYGNAKVSTLRSIAGERKLC